MKGEINMQEQLKWIPFTSEYNEEQKREMLQGEIPENDQEILVTDGKNVWSDTFINEGECYLDSGCYLVSEVIAWMPLPKPYTMPEKEKGQCHGVSI